MGFEQYCVVSGNAPVDERNLLYVAVTRAKKHLMLSPRMLSILKACGVSYRFLIVNASPNTQIEPLFSKVRFHQRIMFLNLFRKPSVTLPYQRHYWSILLKR